MVENPIIKICVNGKITNINWIKRDFHSDELLITDGSDNLEDEE